MPETCCESQCLAIDRCNRNHLKNSTYHLLGDDMIATVMADNSECLMVWDRTSNEFKPLDEDADPVHDASGADDVERVVDGAAGDVGVKTDLDDVSGAGAEADEHNDVVGGANIADNDCIVNTHRCLLECNPCWDVFACLISRHPHSSAMTIASTFQIGLSEHTNKSLMQC
jgi:hypothetical protein